MDHKELGTTFTLTFGAVVAPLVSHLACQLRFKDLSAILDSSDSNWFMLCPWAMSFFQNLCPALFSPVTKPAPSP